MSEKKESSHFRSTLERALTLIKKAVGMDTQECPTQKTSGQEPQESNLLQDDYNIVIDMLRQEHSWKQESVEQFTIVVNFLLRTEHRNYVIQVITETAKNIRASNNEATLALIKARQK